MTFGLRSCRSAARPRRPPGRPPGAAPVTETLIRPVRRLSARGSRESVRSREVRNVPRRKHDMAVAACSEQEILAGRLTIDA